jgi:hypothetical protein
MNDTSLESILEEAFQSVLRSSFPHTTASIVIDHPIVDLSFSTAAAVVADETVIHRENVDVSYSNQQNVSRSTSHVLHDTLILYQNYQENMRLYQNNVSMMVRHLQNIDRRSPFTRQRSRNSGDHEIHNFPFYGIFPVGTTGSSESYDIPTINHFTNATEYCIYDRETMGGTRSCPITLDEFQDNEQICRIKHCRHIFKSVALQNWFSRNAYCPVCRYDIRRSII